MPAGPGSSPPSPAGSHRLQSAGSMSLPSLRPNRSAGDLSHSRKSEEGPPKDGIHSRNWCSENKRLLHQHRERQWLRRKGKHRYIDFSDSERAELQRYFDALAVSNRISLEQLEVMLISLGVASTRREVHQIVAKIDADGNGVLDFEEYLEIFRTRTDSEIFQVFKSMMEGKLGDRNLHFQTVISAYRRGLFIEATGARTMRPVRLHSDDPQMDHSNKVLGNFAVLQRARYEEAHAAAQTGGHAADPDLLPFDTAGSVPPGGLGMVWRGVADQYGLVPTHASVVDRCRRALGPPASPRAVIAEIVKVPPSRRRSGGRRRTVVIPAPALEAC